MFPSYTIPPSTYFVSPQEAIHNVLKAYGIDEWTFTSNLMRPGEMTIITDKELSEEIKAQIDYVRPAGLLITYETKEPKACICIGPPLRCCPVHGI